MTTTIHIKTLTGEILLLEMEGTTITRNEILHALHASDPDAFPLERTDLVETSPGWYMVTVYPPMSVKLIQSQLSGATDNWKYTFYHSVNGFSSYEEHEVTDPRTEREEQLNERGCLLPATFDIVAYVDDDGVEKHQLSHYFSTRPHHMYTGCGKGETPYRERNLDEFLDDCRHDWSDAHHCKRLTEEAKSSIKRLLAIHYRRPVPYPVPSGATSSGATSSAATFGSSVTTMSTSS